MDPKSLPTYYPDPIVMPPECYPHVDHLVTEDDTPMDNLLAEKQARLLVDVLQHSWAGPAEGGQFLAMMNVGLFFSLHEKPLVPDFLLSLNVQLPKEWWREKENRSYFIWVFSKPPDLVLEIVSNKEGGETDRKLQGYARQGIPYYVIYDPLGLLGEPKLRVYELHVRTYRLREDNWVPEIRLGLTVSGGEYEGADGPWLRWCDQQGQILPTGKEAIALEKQRADRLAEKLRQLGADPES